VDGISQRLPPLVRSLAKELKTITIPRQKHRVSELLLSFLSFLAFRSKLNAQEAPSSHALKNGIQNAMEETHHSSFTFRV
jgi:hypothetical protein